MEPILDDRKNEEKFNELVDITKSLMESTHVPGVALGIAAGDEEYIAGLGVTSVENPLPVTPETLFHNGSTNKTVTSTILFHLIERGFVSLDDRVRKYLPDFKVASEETAASVTIRNLLNHTSGWQGDYMVETGEGDDAMRLYIEKMADLQQLTPLGELFTYNNAGFNVVGRVIEVITGKPYETAAREIVLDPLEMTNTFFFPHEIMLHRFAVGHVYNDGVTKTTRRFNLFRSYAACGGRCNSDVRDQLRYARFHISSQQPDPTGKYARVLKPETLQLMQAPSVPTDDGGWMGMNWFIKQAGHLRYLEHGGSTSGQQSALWFAPEQNFAMTVLTNETAGYVLHFEICKWVQEHFLHAVEPTPAALELSQDQIQEFAGPYHVIGSSDVFEIKIDHSSFQIVHVPGQEEDGRQGQAYPPFECMFYAPDKFMITKEPFKGLKGDFLRGKDGKIAWLRFSGRVFAR